MSGAPEEAVSRKPVAEGDPLLRTDGLIKIYNGRSVVNGVDINVKRGEIVGEIGRASCRERV